MASDGCCTITCNRKEHGDFINAALTKRDVSDEELISFLNYTCDLCGSSKDSTGRSALHMAASCGRTTVCKFLVCQKQAKIDEKDAESGYTALHRSIFYGKIDTAVALIQLGASTEVLDKDDWSPSELALFDNFIPHQLIQSRSIYVWGENTNYTLGPTHSRTIPDYLDSFHEPFPDEEPIQICLEKYHTAIVTMSGDVFTFGHGMGGRLGNGSEKSVLEPNRIKFSSKNQSKPVVINACALARDHSLFLSTNGQVWSCGLNTHHVLGLVPPPSHSVRPKRINKLENIVGIACGRYHSVAWSAYELYTWGFNGGQLGHNRCAEPTISAPKRVLHFPRHRIISVAASNCATAFLTDRDKVYVFHERTCQVVMTKYVEDIKSVFIYGGHLDGIDEKHEELKVVALTECGRMLIWQESDPQMCRCTFPFNRAIVQVCLNAWGLILKTALHEVFTGKFKERKNKTQQIEKNPSFRCYNDLNSVTVHVKKVTRISDAMLVTCDREGRNFAAVHINMRGKETRLPVISPTTICEDFAKLPSIEMDTVVTFQIGNRLFPMHRYFLGNISDQLRQPSEDPIVLTNIYPEIFEQICQYAYTGTCELLTEGPVPQNLAMFISKRSKYLYASHGPLRLLQEAAQQLGIQRLDQDINAFQFIDDVIKLRPDKQYQPKELTFSRSEGLENLFDVRISSSCGNYAEANKCVLSARCEFFANLFSTRWDANTAKISLPFRLPYIHKLLDYIYTDRVHLDGEDVDVLLNLLVLADHILLNRLREMCELALVAHITNRNVLKLLTIAHMYNATQLKSICMEFIFFKLAVLLESRRLEQLDDDLLQQLSLCYSTWNPRLMRRVITPFSDATSDERIKEIYAHSPVKLDFDEIIKASPTKMHRKRHRKHRCVATSANDVVGSLQEIIPLDKKAESHKLAQPDDSKVSTPPRLLAITKAMQDMGNNCESEEEVTPFVNLSSPKEFPGLSGSFESSKKSPRSANKNIKMTRLSQKERKRLISLKSCGEECADSASMAESPKNPWNVHLEMEAAAVNCRFEKIVAEEKKQREKFVRLKSKSLVHTQMEDRALLELEKFYNVDNAFDEIIQVRRVDCVTTAAPLWVQK